MLQFHGTPAEYEHLEIIANQFLFGQELIIDSAGNASLVATSVQGPPTPQQAAFASTLAAAIDDPRVVTIGLVSGSPDVLAGNYLTGQIDVQDLWAAGTDLVVSGPALLAHEVAEQTAKQFFGLPDQSAGYEIAHSFGIGAQEAVSGFARGETWSPRTISSGFTGTTTTTHTRGKLTITVTIRWVNGNLGRSRKNERDRAATQSALHSAVPGLIAAIGGLRDRA